MIMEYLDPLGKPVTLNHLVASMFSSTSLETNESRKNR